VVSFRRNEVRRESRRVVAIVVVLVGIQIALLLLMRASSTSNGDPFDSPLYRWSWVLIPACAFGVSFIRPHSGLPLLWVASLMAPLMIGVALLGTVWHDSDNGASLWIVGEMFLLLQGTVALLAASAALLLRRRRAST